MFTIRPLKPVLRPLLTAFALSLAALTPAIALDSGQILVVANSDIADSTAVAEYYCKHRNVPSESILSLPLGSQLKEEIARDDYDSRLAEPIRAALATPQLKDNIRCLLLVYGVPYKVGPRGPLQDEQKRLPALEQALQTEQQKLKGIESDIHIAENIAAEREEPFELRIRQLQSVIDRIKGNETQASVDSELSMVLFEPYELYRWQPNTLNSKSAAHDARTLMTARLDGPTPAIATGLIDKALKAERNGLKGNVYIDTRGFGDDRKPHSYGHYDQSLRDLALLMRLRTKLPVFEENTQELFQPGACPDTAIYCGWYKLASYVDAFDFVDGAIGFHIASLEAKDLRDPTSTQWCPAMLADGITATLGPVTEPYLHAFPEPSDFFGRLLNGDCLAEAYYHSKPFNSWMMVLIGDPLYTPFPVKKTGR